MFFGSHGPWGVLIGPKGKHIILDQAVTRTNYAQFTLAPKGDSPGFVQVGKMEVGTAWISPI